MNNLDLAYRKARKRKTLKPYVVEFEKNLGQELQALHNELSNFTYQPQPLKKFIVRDPKTRVIHASAFRDRVVYHALVNIIEPIFEKIFINDSYASRKNKGTLNAIISFDRFKRKASCNGKLVKDACNNNLVRGYVLKADIKHYFQAVDHEVLLNILKRKIADEKVIWLINKTLDNFDGKEKGRGMPLGNLTSQFFANVYLNQLDYFVKHTLRAKYYERYVDDFVILHHDRNVLAHFKDMIEKYLKCLKLELHPDKSSIIPLRNGVTFLGYRIFYHYKLLRKVNMRKVQKKFECLKRVCLPNSIKYDEIYECFQGWMAYASHANTYKLRKKISTEIKGYFPNEISTVELNKLEKCIP